MVDPSLILTLDPQARRGMALSALSVAFDALLCGGGGEKTPLILQVAEAVAVGVAGEGKEPPGMLDASGAQRSVGD